MQAWHNDFYIAKNGVYNKCGFRITHLNAEEESREYGAGNFKLNEKEIKFRVAKITPAKTGQFVTIWKRNLQGITEPFNETDPFDFIVISCRNCDNLGQFVFPKWLLVNKGIVAGLNNSGKRGTRVYAPWDKVTNKQAEKTQRWQTPWFLPIIPNGFADVALAVELFKTNAENRLK